MNIERFMNPKSDQDPKKGIYAGSFRRSCAAMLDVTIVLFIRVLTAQIIGMLLVTNELKKFLLEFKDKFGTEFVKNNPDHIDYVLHHRIFLVVLIFYALVIFVGTLYHALLNSSAWQGTIGKRVANIAIEKENGAPISFNLGLCHYFLSVLPFLFIMYLIAYQITHGVTFYQAVTASAFNVFFGVLFLLWTQIHTFTKRKTTAYDLICKTVLVNKKTAAQFPWSKPKISNFL